MTAGVYNVGDLAALSMEFFSDNALTTHADPTAVTLAIRNPAGVTSDVSADVLRVSEGVYAYPWTPLVGGMHQIRWVGTGTIQAAETETISVLGWPLGSASGPIYLTSAQLKASLEMTGTSFADADVDLAVGAASRAVDTITGRRFWLDADATKVRYYTPRFRHILQIDDLVAVTSVAIDRSGSGTFSESWTRGTDYVLEPYNAPSDMPARPYERLRVRQAAGRWLPECIEQSVKITGQFGWAAAPDDVTVATGILAAKLLKRGREAPFGVVMGVDSGVAMRIARMDPDVYTLLDHYVRYELFVV